MQTMVRLRAARYLALLMVSTVAIPYLACGALAARPSESVVQTVVVFPLDDATTAGNPEVVADLDAFLGEGLAVCERYRVVTYSERLPAIQRLVAMQPEKKADTVGPFSTDPVAIRRAAMLGKAMAADLLVVGALNKYAFDEEKATAEVTVGIDVLDGPTGNIIEAIAVTGRANKPAASATATEASIAAEAVNDAGRKIIEEITGEEYRDPGEMRAALHGKKKSKKSWIPMLLLSIGVGLLLGGSGGGGGSESTPDSPPDPPLF